MHNGAIMPSEVRHGVDAGQAYPLVRLTGVLDLQTASEVRSALLDVLARQPQAVVVDVAELDVAQPDATAVLRDVHRETAEWPGAHLALCDPRDARVWRDTGWPVWRDRTEAFVALGTPDLGQRLSLDLDPVAGAARRGREVITQACARWELTDLTGSACIVATEMVNNVVAHAGTPMTVLLAVHGSGLSVAVRDQSPILPTYTGTPVPPTAHGGRGMLLIDSVASRWGSLVLAGGKVVWALLTGEEGPWRAGGPAVGAWPIAPVGRNPVMRDNDYPNEVSDPEASGLPETADDDSTAYDAVDSPRWADGPDPAALAGTGPGGSTRFGTTAEEQREGESLDRRLRQEEPDFGAEDPNPAPRDPYDDTADDPAERAFDADVWGASPTSDPKSKVSLYDDGQLDYDDPAPVGRLVAPDEGSGVDDEPDSVAYDAGAAGGGASAEELAVHRTNPPGWE